MHVWRHIHVDMHTWASLTCWHALQRNSKVSVKVFCYFHASMQHCIICLNVAGEVLHEAAPPGTAFLPCSWCYPSRLETSKHPARSERQVEDCWFWDGTREGWHDTGNPHSKPHNPILQVDLPFSATRVDSLLLVLDVKFLAIQSYSWPFHLLLNDISSICWHHPILIGSKQFVRAHLQFALKQAHRVLVKSCSSTWTLFKIQATRTASWSNKLWFRGWYLECGLHFCRASLRRAPLFWTLWSRSAAQDLQTDGSAYRNKHAWTCQII